MNDAVRIMVFLGGAAIAGVVAVLVVLNAIILSESAHRINIAILFFSPYLAFAAGFLTFLKVFFAVERHRRRKRKRIAGPRGESEPASPATEPAP